VGIRRRILISCFICFASVSIHSTPMTQLSPDGAPVLELQVQDQVLALTPEQVSPLIERATADDVQAQCVLGVAYARNCRTAQWCRSSKVADESCRARHRLGTEHVGKYVSPRRRCFTRLY